MKLLPRTVLLFCASMPKTINVRTTKNERSLRFQTYFKLILVSLFENSRIFLF